MAAEDVRSPSLDVAIIGGGPAGMSAALTTGRALLATIVVNAESPRNAVTTASHGFLTRDGAHPSELLAVAKTQLEKYDTVRYVNDTVVSATATATGFEVTLTGGEAFETGQLIIATGHTDDLGRLGLPGIENVHGTSVYPCLFCDGFEHRGERIALFGRQGAIHYAPMGRLWTDDLIVFTNGEPITADDASAFDRNAVPVHTAPIRRLESFDGRLLAVELVSGERIERDAGFIADDSRPNAGATAKVGRDLVTTDAKTFGLVTSIVGAAQYGIRSSSIPRQPFRLPRRAA